MVFFFLFVPTFEVFADLRANLTTSLISHRSRPSIILLLIKVIPLVSWYFVPCAGGTDLGVFLVTLVFRYIWILFGWLKYSWVLKTVFYRLGAISQVAILLISILISQSCCPEKSSSSFWRSRLLGIFWSLVSFWDKCCVFFRVTDDSSLLASASQYSCIKIMGRSGGNSLNHKTSHGPVNSGFSFKVYGSQMLPDLFPVVFTWMVALLPSPFAQ